MSEVIDLGPRSEKERLIFAIEEMRVSVQWAIQEAMVDKGINRAELARRLGISAARVTQMLSEDANPRLETIAKVAFCLDVDLTLART
ncbi:MAG: helix-turn-helix domain-containing protein, partial [Alphaproteobacteria bacterium]|nr:helix-turn-helix domain-containing protein [Alphaproteobacteria bacterium]